VTAVVKTTKKLGKRNQGIYSFSMTTTVTTKNMISIPVEIARKFGVKPGFLFDWFETTNADEIRVRVIPDRLALSRRLKGAGRRHAPERDAVAELIQERVDSEA
jgi:bifunctional DNA-binding transcriptional regulator/antitoxin component of YhaV-PrlF toxin-antitoxin module